MRLRLAAPWGALVLVLAAVFAYTVGAQSVSFWPSNDTRLTIKAVPEGKDIRSFYAALTVQYATAPVAPVDLFAVPNGKVFVVTDVVFGTPPASGSAGQVRVRLRENGGSGPIRAEFMVQWMFLGGGTGSASAGSMAYPLQSGIPFPPGATITAEALGTSSSTNPQPVTISGYLADAF